MEDHRTGPELVRLQLAALERGDRSGAAALAAIVRARQERHHTGEILDIYDDDLAPSGVKERGLVHLDGDWHRSLHCWLCSPARGTLLFQRRALTKATFPGRLDVTVAGHLRAGETVAQACRESEEEIGLRVDAGDLVPLGRCLYTARHGYLIDREIVDIFLYPTDVALTALRPDPAEVAGVLEAPAQELLALFQGDIPVARARDAAGQDVEVGREEFTLPHDRSYARVAWQALRLIARRAPVAI